MQRGEVCYLEVDVICERVVEDVHARQLWRHLQVCASGVVVNSGGNEPSLTPLRRSHAVVEVHNLGIQPRFRLPAKEYGGGARNSTSEG